MRIGTQLIARAHGQMPAAAHMNLAMVLHMTLWLIDLTYYALSQSSTTSAVSLDSSARHSLAHWTVW